MRVTSLILKLRCPIALHMHIEKMTMTEARVDKPFSTRDSGHCCLDGVVAAPSPDFGRMLHSRVEALLDERDGPFAKWTKIQTLRASRAHGAMSARNKDAIDVARATDFALVTWARVFFLVAIRVLAVKLHVANEVLERLATFLERSSPSTVFGVLLEDLSVKIRRKIHPTPTTKNSFYSECNMICNQFFEK